MKFSWIYKFSASSLLAINLLLIPLSNLGQAQTEVEPKVTVIETEDKGFDWGWLGLLGLLGLAGLAGKNNHLNSEVIVKTKPFPKAITRSGASPLE